MSYVIAVDPGLTGALAVFHEGGQLINVFDMPTEEVGNGFVKRQVDAVSLRQKIEQFVERTERAGDLAYPGAVAMVERVTAMPGQGVTTMLSLGDSRGTLRGVLSAMGIVVREVLPQIWKRDMGLIEPRPKGSAPMTKQEKNERQKKAKAASVEMVKQAYPAFAHCVQRAKDHGRAEAILIGAWALLKGWGKL